jgi:predicted nuclease of predicted toxin-antitoxin system
VNGGRLIVLLDEGTPVSAADPFYARNHGVIPFADALEPGSKDDLVAWTAIQNNAALIAVDNDMKRLVRRFGVPNDNPRYPSLHLISISCGEVLAAKRIEHAMSFIEHEWRVACEKKARRLWVDIAPHRLTSCR